MPSRSAVCLAPFFTLTVFEQSVNVCCYSLGYPISSPGETLLTGKGFAIDELWNGERMIAFRESMYDGSFKFCDMKACRLFFPGSMFEILLDDIRAPSQFTVPQRVLECLERRGTVLPLPVPMVGVAYDASCNLSCPSCRSSRIMMGPEAQAAYARAMPSIAGNAEELYLGGSGEPLASRHQRDWLFSAKEQDISNLGSVCLNTNGTLLSEKTWKRVSPAIVSREVHLYVSLDGATKETIELNRRGAKFKSLSRNLAFMATCEDFNSRTFRFVLQQNNFRELKDFVAFARAHEAGVKIERIDHWEQSEGSLLEKDVCRPDHPEHAELVEIVRDPIFDDEDVVFHARGDLLAGSERSSSRRGYGFGFFSRGLFARGSDASMNGVEFQCWSRASVSRQRHDSREIPASVRLSVGDDLWLGVGFAHEEVIDVSTYQAMCLTLRSTHESTSELRVLIKDGPGRVHEERVADHGFLGDGEIHQVRIPLGTFEAQGVDLTAVAIPFGMTLASGCPGDSVEILDLWLDEG